MKILLTTHQFFPHFSAGTEVLTRAVARELLRRGHVVHVLTGYPGGMDLADDGRFDEYDYEGMHVYRFQHAYIPMGGQESLIEIGYDNQLGANYFERILKTFKPDLVHFFHLDRLGTGLIERAVLAGIPRFMTLTDFWAICPTSQLLLSDGGLCAGPSAHAGNCLKHFAQDTQEGVVKKAAELLPVAWADLLVRFTQKGFLPVYPKRVEVEALATRLSVNVSRLNTLNGLVAPNRFIRQIFVRHGVMPDLITEAAFGIETAEHNENKQRLEPQIPLRIAFIGTLAAHKGCHILIDAFLKLNQASATLKIYGRLEDFPDYVHKLQLLTVSHRSIEFCGTFPNKIIGEIMQEIDVLVVPSIWHENTPLVVYSAQDARCPVVASNLPGLAAVVEDNVNGLLFNSGDSSDLARQLSRLIHEKGLLGRLSAQARTPKSTEKYVDELFSLWQEV